MTGPLLSPALISWVEMQNERLAHIDGKTVPATDRERIFWQLAKLAEETGELADAILALHGLQRSDKAYADAKEETAAECADVVLVTLLLSQRLGVDIGSALQQKMTKIDNRYAPSVGENAAVFSRNAADAAQ